MGSFLNTALKQAFKEACKLALRQTLSDSVLYEYSSKDCSQQRQL
jgi:hypothetical protein